MSSQTTVADILELDPVVSACPGRRAALYFGTKQLRPETKLAQLELGKDATLKTKVGGLLGGVAARSALSPKDANTEAPLAQSSNPSREAEAADEAPAGEDQTKYYDEMWEDRSQQWWQQGTWSMSDTGHEARQVWPPNAGVSQQRWRRHSQQRRPKA